PAELLQIERRALAEGDIENRIVGIIRRAGEGARRDPPPGGEMDDRRLPFGKIGYVAAHVVEQQGEIVRLQHRELGEPGGKHLLPAAPLMEMQFEGAEPDAEADSLGAADVA